MQVPKERWLFISEWMSKNESKVRSFVYKRYYLNYSAYLIDDFIAEAYIVAYEALSICRNKPFEGYFWTLFKQKCKSVLANQPHKSFLIGNDVRDSYEANYDDEDGYMDEQYAQTIAKYLNILLPPQKQICRLIAFANEPIRLEDIANAIGITYKAALARFNSSIKRIKEARLYEEEHI
ncbi:MAG: hypothetical protein LBV04_10395 [Deferribacteraceae bacterium]|nr:hypothetical protein [Deferribacteraceae bacterium]